MDNIDTIEKWLIDNEVKYFKGDCGTLSINLNDIPKELAKEYHELCYKLNKEAEAWKN